MNKDTGTPREILNYSYEEIRAFHRAAFDVADFRSQFYWAGAKDALKGIKKNGAPYSSPRLLAAYEMGHDDMQGWMDESHQ